MLTCRGPVAACRHPALVKVEEYLVDSVRAVVLVGDQFFVFLGVSPGLFRGGPNIGSSLTSFSSDSRTPSLWR